MKRFLNLLKKEIKELVNVQLVVSLAFTLLLFNFVGQMSRKEVQKAIGVQTISALDLDGSASSQAVLTGLESARFKIVRIEGKTKEQAIDIARGGESKLLLVIPSGFGDSLKDFKPSQIETYSYMRSFSLIGSRGSAIVRGVISALNNVLSDSFLKEKLPGLDPASLKNPIKSKDFVIVHDRMAEASAAEIAGLVSSQSMFIPIVLMMIVMYSSSLVISAVAMEKQNKTLETLLTVPIRRTSIITAKMFAAGLVGLISAGVYMVGMKSFLGGIGGDELQAATSQSGAVMRQLGLYFDTSGYIILGAALFLAILVALALAMILGVLAEDFRSAQNMMMPMMFMVLIPYFLSLFADINTVSLPVKIFILAIPFSHPFLVSQNLYLGNYGMIFGGLAYMLIVFGILVVFAARIFSTDKILTMKLRFGKKRGATA
ncbi:MAG: ABC transporter permease [Candidatus Aminicenantes bacterium]|nr:ABC transporter permease [Candidatus Aminicenantes bacterium]MCJ7488424.1 ABC transporter permease [Candidatus Aminicenantes bacterium]TFG58334.1 MAG: ABC transporter permease [Candidatus Aminicenantes bacterium]